MTINLHLYVFNKTFNLSLEIFKIKLFKKFKIFFFFNFTVIPRTNENFFLVKLQTSEGNTVKFRIFVTNKIKFLSNFVNLKGKTTRCRKKD